MMSKGAVSLQCDLFTLFAYFFHNLTTVNLKSTINTLVEDVFKLLAQSSVDTTWKEKLNSMRLLTGWIKQTFIYYSCPMTHLKMAFRLNDFCRMFYIPAATQAWEHPYHQCLMLSVIWHFFLYHYSSWFCTEASFTPWGRQAYSTLIRKT